MPGAVAAGSDAAAAVGAEVLAAGGNAADAAIAAVFASFVSEVFYTCPAAGGLALVREPDGAHRAFDGFAAMPGQGAGPEIRARLAGEAPLDFRETVLRFESTDLRFHLGRGSAAVPGLPKLLDLLHERYASWPLADLLAPARTLAERAWDYPAPHRAIARVLRPILTDTPDCAARFGGEGDDFLAGPAPVRHDRLRALLDQLRDEGLESFYRGSIAQAIVADQARRGGLITERDLARFRVLEAAPLRVRVAGWQLLLPPPPSQGGVLVAAMLGLWSALSREGGPLPGSAGHARRWARVIDAVNGARGLFERAESAERREAILRWILPQLLADEHADAPPRGAADPRPRGNTTHVSAVDHQGLAVSLSSSAGETAGYLVPGPGLMMNNLLGEGDLHHAGFHALPSGERLATMMAPALLLRGDPRRPEALVALGSGGSARIRTAISQTAWSIAGEGLSLRRAVERPRVHYEEGRLHLEGDLDGPADPALAAALSAGGWSVEAWPGVSGFFGGVHAARAERAHRYDAQGDPRRAGAGRIARGGT